MQDVAGGSLIDASAFRELLVLKCEENHVEMEVFGIPTRFGIADELSNETFDFTRHCVEGTSVEGLENVKDVRCSWIGVV